MYKITAYCIDFDNDGAELIKNMLENHKYIHMFKFASEEADIGEWKDDNILNFNDTPIEEFEKCFKS